MKQLSRFSVNYPVTVLMLVCGVLLLGYISFDKLGMDLFPDLNNPRIYIELEAGEQPPAELEDRYVRTIESLAIRQKQAVEVTSVMRVGSAQISVAYSWDADMDEAFLDLQKAINTFSQTSDLDKISLSQYDPNTTPMMLIALRNPEIQDLDRLRQTAENYLRNELTRQDGIAAVEILGGETRAVEVVTDPYLLEAYGLTLAEIASQIRSANVTASGGSVEEMGRRYIIKGISDLNSLQAIGEVIVARRADDGDANPLSTVAGDSPSGMTVPVYLRDVATISVQPQPLQNIVRLNGERCLALAIYKETRFNTVNAAGNLESSLETLRRALPGYQLIVVNNQAAFIQDAIGEVEQTALIGIFLAILVLYGFLRQIAITAIISIAIPISIVATFTLMYFNGLTLNIMTLGGLALGAGMLVDNAIVVMENIFRRREEGESPREAAVNGSAQVGGAIAASTFTTIIVFLPIVYLQSAAGELFKEQAWTVACSLLSSLAVALLVIPMLSDRFTSGQQQNLSDRKAIHFKGYRQLLDKFLQRRWQIIASAALLVIITALILPSVDTEFLPRTESKRFAIEVTMEEGTVLSNTSEAVRSMESLLRDLAGENTIQSIYSRIGAAGGLSASAASFFEDEHTASIDVQLRPESSTSVATLIDQFDRQFSGTSDITLEYLQSESALQTTLNSGRAPLIVEIRGDEPETLRDLANNITARLADVPELLSVENEFDAGRTELNVNIDRLRAGLENLSMDNITEQLREQLSGAEAGEWDDRGSRRDITVRIPQQTAGSISQMRLKEGSRTVRLDQVADIRYEIAPSELFRRNQSRIGRVFLQLQKDVALSKAVSAAQTAIDDLSLPQGYSLQIAGEERERSAAFLSLRFAFLLSLALIYMVLAAQFESLIHPFTIILTVPLSVIGAILTFYLLGLPLNIMAYIGIILLIGIAVNDSIILVDAINQFKNEGLSTREAILEAGQRRIRPIVMTSLTTILALLPLTFGIGESAALRTPMALAVIGGLITSTLLTLAVIPCVYSVLDRLNRPAGEAANA